MNKLVQWLNTKKQKWFNKFVFVLGPLSGLISIIDICIKYIKVFDNIRVVDILREKIWYLNIFTMLCWIVFSTVLIFKYRTSAIDKMDAISYGLNKAMRKTMSQLKKMDEYYNVFLSITDYSCDTCSARNKLKEDFIESYIAYTSDFLDILSDFLNSFSSRSGGISTSYKMIIPDDFGNPNEDCTITLARSKNTLDERKTNDKGMPSPIKDNSDFNNIVDADINQRGNTYFYVSDLEEYQSLLEKITDGSYKYMNSNPQWRRYYNSTMVVPVGIPEENGEIYGFLCADSLWSRDFTKKQKDVNIRVFMGYAQIYSLVVSKFTEIEKILWNNKEAQIYGQDD